MRILHIAAMPFPSQQGTQALLHAMLSALVEAGHDTHLLCYPRAGFERAAGYTVHRSADLSRDRSLRSGPSLRKVVQDLGLARALLRLHARLRPERVIAHHVEAALCAQLAGVSDLTFVAHTSLSAELPSYFPAALETACALAGRGVDAIAAQPATRRLAISPLLQARLSQETGRAFELLVPPWSAHAPIAESERRAARTRLGLSHDAEVVLYAGNLDAYQGLDTLCAGLELAVAERPGLRWLLATGSVTARFVAELAPRLRDRTRCVTLDSDGARRVVHAASDLALVPRRSPGGLPIKLLDALAHGLPVLACARATAGFDFGAACTLLADDEPRAWPAALRRHFDLSHEHRRAFADRARELVRLRHGPEACVAGLLAPGA